MTAKNAGEDNYGSSDMEDCGDMEADCGSSSGEEYECGDYDSTRNYGARKKRRDHAYKEEVQASKLWRKHSKEEDFSQAISLIEELERRKKCDNIEELEGYMDRWVSNTSNTPYPNRAQILNLFGSAGGTIAVTMALCPKGVLRSTEFPAAKNCFFAECEERIKLAFSKGTGEKVGNSFFFDFKPYCWFYPRNKRPTQVERDKEITPGNSMYRWNTLYVRFTLAMINLVRKIVYITCIGSVVQIAVSGKTYLQLLRDSERGSVGDSQAGKQDKKKLRKGKESLPPAMSVPLRGVEIGHVFHAAAIAHKAGSPGFITITMLRELIANVDYVRICVFIKEQIALGVVKESQEELVKSVVNAMLTIKRKELLSPVRVGD